ncbi:hypothetical protein HY78_21405 [Rhizorhabdus wittichii DC-6]|nr:hypothetical protein HY78_21405 [Rhizorhabdus wittichii DC-6]
MYERALSPIRIGGLEIRNRIARTAHATMMARDGKITDELIAYHLARAQGGVGLTILEAAGVHPSAVLSLANLDDTIIDGYRRLATAIAPTGMRLFQQLWHGGHIYMQPDGSPPLAPSTVPSPIAGVAPRPFTLRQIDELVAAYGAAARRVEKGGLDGVEVHAGHGYLAQSARSCDFGHLGEHVGNGLVVVDDRPCEERRSAPIRERRYEPWRFEWGSDRLLEPEFFGHRVRDRQSGDGTTGIGGSA